MKQVSMEYLQVVYTDNQPLKESTFKEILLTFINNSIFRYYKIDSIYDDVLEMIENSKTIGENRFDKIFNKIGYQLDETDDYEIIEFKKFSINKNKFFNYITWSAMMEQTVIKTIQLLIQKGYIKNQKEFIECAMGGNSSFLNGIGGSGDDIDDFFDDDSRQDWSDFYGFNWEGLKTYVRKLVGWANKMDKKQFGRDTKELIADEFFDLAEQWGDDDEAVLKLAERGYFGPAIAKLQEIFTQIFNRPQYYDRIMGKLLFWFGMNNIDITDLRGERRYPKNGKIQK